MSLLDTMKNVHNVRGAVFFLSCFVVFSVSIFILEIFENV